MENNKKGYIIKDYYLEKNEKKFEVVRELHDEKVRLHFHDYLEGELILKGEGIQYINDYKVYLKKGCFSLLRPNIDCHSLELDNVDVFKFYVKPFFLDEEIWKEISLLQNPLVIELSDDDLDNVINMFQIVQKSQNKQDKYNEKIVKNIINSLLCVFAQVKNGLDNNVDNRKNVISYLLDNDRYLTEVSLQDFANDFNYSLSHASKYFKENTGMTFSEAKQFFRIQYAKRLLLSSTYSTNEISNMCGFNYYPLFNNVFKKNTGMTPFEFRKSNR